MKIIPHPSPNFGERKGQAAPSLVVLHYTAMVSVEAALARLSAPEFQVSAHYLVAEDGRVFRLVDEDKRAWHAGQGAWGATRDVNSASIGIELANPSGAPFAAPLMRSLEALLADILKRHRLGPQAVIGHSDCAPGRKIDPGPRFDWRRLARTGLSVWPRPQEAPPDPELFAALLGTFGYAPDAAAAKLLAAFRLRFFPGAQGPLRAPEMGAAADLARRYPVDPRGATA